MSNGEDKVPPEKANIPTMNRFNLAAGIIIAAVLIFGAFSATRGTERPAERATTNSAVKNNPFEITVTGVKEKNGKSSDSKFVVVEVKAQNSNNKPASIMSSMFKLKDSRGNEYSADTFASNISDLSVNPGLTRTGNVSFEVPTNASGFVLGVSSDMFDFGGADYKYVDLGAIK
ncbi:DUF4352 domain-containing protein [Paenibacillus sp. SN-8-1]|uniref:DUF4352 domain-containing protein n=1 Tax=Paenibacillus sp. SN-8-1 TaxID=3435409 RepID=UPI003D9A1F5A